MTKIFISYRRQDTKAIAGRIFDRLEAKFGRDAVFMDIDSIPPGVDFHDWLDEQVSRAEIVLALIGHGWTEVRDERGDRRLDNPNDFVRIELEAAIARRIPLVPVLIDSAPFPRADELPDSLKPLTRRNAAFVDAGRDFNVHVARLIEALERHLNGGWGTVAAPLARPAAPTLLYEDAAARLVRSFTGHSAYVSSVAFSSDGHFALSGSGDNTLMLWDVRTTKALRRFIGQSSEIESVALSPDGRFALSCANGAMIFWDVATAEELREFSGYSGGGQSVAFSHDGRFALSDSLNSSFTLWDVGTARRLRSFTGHSTEVTCVAFSPDGRLALSGSSDNTLMLWDVATAKAIRTFVGHSDGVNSVAFSPDGRRVLSGSSDGTAMLWDVATATVMRGYTAHTGEVFSVAFSPDGRLALTGGLNYDDPTLFLWSVETAKTLHFMKHSYAVWSVAFSPDGRFALSGGGDHTLKLWDVSEWTQAR